MSNVDIKDSLAVMILAAGASSRLGQMKQLLSIENTSLIERQLRLSLAISNHVFCVLGCKHDKVMPYIAHLPITTIINTQWQQGLASSIACGVRKLPKHISAVMLVLVDQWQLTEQDFFNYQQQWVNHTELIHTTVMQSSNSQNEKWGPPTIFPQRYFAELTKLTGDQGAKSLLQKESVKLQKLYLPRAFIDVDTPKQLVEMQIELNKNNNNATIKENIHDHINH